MKVLLHSEKRITADVKAVLAEAKRLSGIEEEMQFAPLEPGFVPPRGVPVLSLGTYKRRGEERVVQTYSGAQIMMNADSISRVSRAFKLLSAVPKLTEFEYEVIRTKERYFEVLGTFSKENLTFFDIETSGDISVDYFYEVSLLCFSISQYGTPQYVVAEEIANDIDVLKPLADLLLCGHNLSFDVKVINALLKGVAKAQISYDTMLGHWVYYPASAAGLKELGESYFGVPDWDSKLKDYTKAATYKERTELEDGAWASARKYSGGSGYERIPRSMLYLYNAYDTHYTRELHTVVDDLLATSESKQRAFKDRIDMANMYMDFETIGTRVDIDHLRVLEAELEEEKVRLLSELAEIAGRPINPNSPKQVMGWFVDNHFPLKSTNEKTLDLAKRKDDMPELIRTFIDKLLECRGNTKALGTYVKATIEMSRGGIIHPSFKLHGVATGRLSTPGKGTGLMTIPREAKYRRMVIPYQEGHVLVKPDYGQLEARVTAVESQDERYINAFQPDSPDFFVALLPSVYPEVDFEGMDSHEKSEYRQGIKPFSHGAHYGRGAKAIAEQLDMPVDRASEILENYLGDHDKGLRAWQTKIKGMARRGDQIETPFGLHLQSELVTYGNRVNVENTALSFLPQSIGNSICVQACLRIHKWIGDYGGHIFLTVHDQILASVPIEHAKEVGTRMEYEMMKSGRDTYGDVVVFEAEPEYGFNWDEKIKPSEWDEYIAAQG